MSPLDRRLMGGADRRWVNWRWTARLRWHPQLAQPARRVRDSPSLMRTAW